MKNLILTTLLILLGASEALPQTPMSAAIEPEWKYGGLSFAPIHGHKDNFFYDTKHIQKGADGIIQLYLKEVGVYDDADEEKRNHRELIQNRKNWPEAFALEKYDTFAYSVFTVEFDCAKKLRRYPCIADFNAKDERIGAQCIGGQDWEKIPQDSMAKRIFDAVCPEK